MKPAPKHRLANGRAKDFSNIVVPLAQAPETRELVLIQLPSNGAIVKEGDLLAQIETQAVRDHLDDVDAMVRQTDLDLLRLRASQQARREAVEQQIRAAKADRDKAREDMKSAPVRSDIQREQFRLVLEENELNYKQMQSDLALLDPERITGCPQHPAIPTRGPAERPRSARDRRRT